MLAGLFLLASLAHFIHNAEYIAYYPGMPGWLTREKVYLFWLAFASPGIVALICARLGWPLLTLAFLAVYGALGLDALGHYALALCSQHTLVANITIWAEVVTGLVLCVAAAGVCARRLAQRLRAARSGV